MPHDEARLLEEKYGARRVCDMPTPVRKAFAYDCARLALDEPLAYVIGFQPFLGLTIRLDSRPLIPRPETEWWTQKLLEDTAAGPAGRGITFLDLCAGSGAIGCAALARLPRAHVYFGERDPAHEATIHKNIRETLRAAARDTTMIYHSSVAETPRATMIYHSGDSDEGDARAHIGIGDLFMPFGEMRFDIIAANPPYVPEDRALPASVADYEPALALRAGEDGLALIRRIARELPFRLAPGGEAWVECDSAHAERARELFAAEGMRAKVMQDQYAEPRVIVVSWK